MDLKAAKAETARFREMLESRADVDDNFKVRCGCGAVAMRCGAVRLQVPGGWLLMLVA